MLTGTVSDNSRDEEDPPIFIDSVQPLADVRAGGGVGILIELTEGDDVEAGAFGRAKELLEACPGRGPLFVEWRRSGNSGSSNGGGDGGGNRPVDTASRFASRSLRVAPNAGLLTDLRMLLGDRVKLVRE